MSLEVSGRARSREDRAGDPLDGLVNLFDIGIVLSVAFLLAALSSLDLTEAITDPDRSLSEQERAEDRVVAEPGETVEETELAPGERVVGRGQPIGTVYQLEDGRTVIVREPGSASAP